jgi:hypothetical protein
MIKFLSIILYRLKVWKLPKYKAYSKKEKPVNEKLYICEVLASLINIVLSDLPENPVVCSA